MQDVINENNAGMCEMYLNEKERYECAMKRAYKITYTQKDDYLRVPYDQNKKFRQRRTSINI